MFFSTPIIHWYLDNKRNLPWRDTTDPYCIWLSEIILQQTRVAQGKAYYERFIERFPTVQELANAPSDEVMKLWEGLGYYSRARNLHTAAKQIIDDFGGQFPSSYSELRKLKGVGDYTAAAVASFAFKLPHAVVDGNVYRVLARYFGITSPIDSTAGKKEFANLAQELLDKTKPEIHNQAIMEFGAIQCTPKSPDCSCCPLLSNCAAYNTGKVDSLPIKAKKTKQRERFFIYVIPLDGDHTYIRKRTETKDIWQNLYEFPLIETQERPTETKTQQLTSEYIGEHTIEHVSSELKHVLSHQILWTRFVVLRTTEQEIPSNKFEKVPLACLSDYAFPKLIVRFIESSKKGLFPLL